MTRTARLLLVGLVTGSASASVALAADPPVVRVQLLLDENSPDPGLAVVGSSAAAPERSDVEIDRALRSAMGEGLLRDEFRRRREYPVIDLAERRIRAGEVDGAIEEYARFLQEDPRDLVVRWRLIRLLQQRGRWAAVLDNADRLLETTPGFGLAVVARGQAEAALGEPGRAVDTFVRALGMPGLPGSARQAALGGLVNAAIAANRFDDADRMLAAEAPGPPDSAVALGQLAARASLAERSGRPGDAAALWARIARSARPAEQRRAWLAQAQLLDAAGRPREGFDVLRSDPVRASFSPDSGAPPALRLSYQRLLGVLAERLGDADVAAAAAAEAVALARSATGAGSGAALVDRLRAARLLQARPDATAGAVLGLLLEDDHLAARPPGGDDATWADYLLLSADVARRAGRADLAAAALEQVPRAALENPRLAARAAVLTDQAGDPARAAALWGRVVATAPGAAERRQAILARSVLLTRAGDTAGALETLRAPDAKTLFASESGAASEERLRYERTVSVLAERLGLPDQARSAAARAAAIQGASSTVSSEALVDRMRASRLQSPGGHDDGLSLLLDAEGQPFTRPAGADDAFWAEYAMLLAETSHRAGRPGLVRQALQTLPAAPRHWQDAAHVAELALADGAPDLAAATLRPWDRQALQQEGASRAETLTVLDLRANAAAATGDRGAEGRLMVEIEALDPRIGSPADRAQRLLAAHDTADAIALLEAARPVAVARLDGGGSEARHRLATLLLTLGQAHWQAGDSEAGARSMGESLSLEDDPGVRLQFADALRRAGRRREAAAEYRRAAQTATNRQQAQFAWLSLGDLLHSDGDDSGAYDAFRTAVAAGAGRAGRLRMAEAADRQGRYADEVDALEPIAADRDARGRLCRALVKMADRQAAADCLDRLVASADHDPSAWRSAADVAGALGRDQDRSDYLETAFHLAPTPELGLAAADGLLAAGRSAEAAQAFGRIVEQTGDPRAMIGRGEALVAAHQPFEATEVLQAALARQTLPGDLRARAEAASGYAWEADGRPDAAIEAWRRALALRPDPALQIAMADTLRRTGRLEQARAALATVDATGAASVPRDAMLARIALQDGDPGTALRLSEQIARAEPSADNLLLLAQARRAAGDDRGALQASEQAAAAATSNASVQAQAGYAALTAGAPALAARHLQQSVALDPGQLGARQDLPRAYARAGDWPDARRAYEDAIQRTSVHLDQTGDERDRQALYALRAENAAATKEFAFELVDTLCAPSSAVGCGLNLPVVERLGSAGIGAVTAVWTPHLPGDPDPGRLGVYVRLLWSNDPGTVSLSARTLQGGVGVRLHPFANLPLYLWAEHLVALGNQSQDNWLLRITAGQEFGADWRNADFDGGLAGWTPYFSIYGDLGHFFIRQQDWLGVIEARAGYATQLSDHAQIIPYLFVRGELDSARHAESNDVQIGAGASLRMRFLRNAMLGDQFSPEVFVRAARDIHRTGGREATRFLFGVIARF